jgi:thiosulfate/3-mercaptopyruvate sulfurtransferase
MKTAIWALVLLFPSLCWAASDARSSDAEEMGELVTAEWLHAHLADDDLVVLDSSVLVLLDENQQMSNVSGYQDFLEAHVPGARFADLLVALSGPEARLAMPSAEAFAKALGELGIHNQDKIVVYSSAMHVWSARLWWMLKWIGHDRVAILDGGLTAWRDAGYPVASDEVSTTRTQYQPRVRAELVSDQNAVRAAIQSPEIQLVDALPAAHYRGEFSLYGRAGHIPTAVNISATELTDAHGRYRRGDELSVFIDLPRDKPVITYCGGGVAAAATAFALRQAGVKDVSVYMGSLQDWLSNPDNPMTTDP